MQITKLFAKNLGLTAAGIVVCVLIGLPVAYVVAGARAPEAVEYLLHGGSVSRESYNTFYQTRNSIIWFAAWCGLISAQTVFATWQFGGGRELAGPPTGAFPVKES